jgi:signal transduction histidine kinase
MNLGIPAKLAPVLFAQALSRLFLVYSAYAVILAEILIILAGWHEGNSLVMWAGFLVGFPGFVLWRLMFTPLSPVSASLYVAFLSGTLLVASWAMLATMPEVDSTLFFPFSLLSFALITTCGVAAQARDRVLWASIGYGSSVVALYLGALLAGKPYVVDFRVLFAFVVVVLAVVTTPSLLEANKKLQSTFDNSVMDIASEAERQENTRVIAARLHDSLLANLAVIATTKHGMLQDPLREAIEHQLAVFETSDLSEHTVMPQPEDLVSAELDQLMEVISQAESLGLTVHLGGNPSSISQLTPERVDALTSALSQCLTNVHSHSGQNAVEVVILPAGDNIAVTVIDGGHGFNVDAVPADRMGIRLSIRDRIERCGGFVQIWSNEGQGTAVMLQLPIERGTGGE